MCISVRSSACTYGFPFEFPCPILVRLRNRTTKDVDTVASCNSYDCTLGVGTLAKTGTCTHCLAAAIDYVYASHLYVEYFCNRNLDLGLVSIRTNYECVLVLIQ